jgi:hypothetical protein
MSPFCESAAILSSGFTSWEMKPPLGNLNPNGSPTLNRNSHALRQLHPNGDSRAHANFLKLHPLSKPRLAQSQCCAIFPRPAWQLEPAIKPCSWMWDFSRELSLWTAFFLTLIILLKDTRFDYTH